MRRPEAPVGNIVATQNEFQDVCASLAAMPRFAFDAEFVAEDGYRAEVCLIQVAAQDRVWLIDPLSGLDTMPFWRLLADPAVEKVVHAGLEDLALGFQQTGLVPHNVFDLQVAAGLVGIDYPISLQRLVQGTVGVRLHKSQTLTNWRQRPLSPPQIEYAVADVAYLLRCHDRLRDELERRGRTTWAQEEFARFQKASSYRTEAPDLLWRVRGVGSLESRGLAVARELAIERERMGEELRRPPRAVLRDHLLVAIARHAWTRTSDLRSLRGLSLREPALRQLTEAVQRALATPPADWPAAAEPDEETPVEVTLSKLVWAVLHDFCQSEGIAFSLLATNKDIRALVLRHTRPDETRPDGGLQRGWRRGAIGTMVADVLDGTRCVRVSPPENRKTLSIEQ